MKKITLFLFALFTCWQINAQVGNYAFSQSSGTYTPISGGTVLGTTTSDDQRFLDPAVLAGGTATTGVGFPIGFNFTFNEIVFDRVAINNNGWISLGQSSLTPSVNMASTSSYDPLSSTSAITPTLLRSRIAGIGDDLQAQTGSELRIETIGSAPNRVFVVQWTNYREYGTAGQNLNFQIRLNETTNVVEVVYGTMTFTVNVETAQVGLGGSASTDFNNRATTTNWNTTTAGTANNSSLTYSTTVTPPVSGLTFVWTPPVPCAGTPVAGTASPANQTLLAGQASAVLSVTGQTSGVSGLTYQWEQSTDGISWVNAVGGTGATTLSYTPPVFGGSMIMYRLRITCTISAETSVSTVATLNSCGALTVPSLETLDVFLPTCWQEADNGDLSAGPTTFLSGAWVVDGFGNQGTTGAARILIDATGDNDWIISPLYAIPATGYELKFDAAATQSGGTGSPTTPWESDDFVEVLVSTGMSNWTVLYTYNAANANIPLNTGTPNIIDLDTYAGQNIRFAFRAVEGAANGAAAIDFSIDNIQVRLTPPCLEPTTLTATNITSSGADLSWIDPTGVQFDYELVVQLAGGGVPAVAGDIVDITSLPLTINTLNPATSYEFWVRANCGVDGNSAWVGPVVFTTSCITVTSFIQNFDTVTAPAFPVCWNKVGSAGTANTQTTSNNTSPNTLYIFSSSGTNLATVAMQPVSNLGAGTHRLRFNMRANFTVGGVVQFGYLTNPTDANSFVSLSNVTASSLTYQQYVVVPPAGAYSNFPAFRHTGVPANSILIDDVVWEVIPVTVPTCSTISTPANAATNVAIETNISWSANVDATGYFLRIGTTPGGSEVLANTDLGNVLTYNPPVDFNYSTVYYVTLTPYNVNGSATSCAETSFTTRNAPPVGSICSNPIVINPLTLPYTTTDNTNLYGDDYSTSPCSDFYMGGDEVIYTITPVTNMSVDILLSGLGDTWSGIHVLNGCPDTATTCVAFQGDAGSTNRDIQDVLLTGGVTYYIVISTFPAPQSVAYTLTITQNTCVNPSVTFTTSNNCPTASFNAVANITNLGSASSLTVSDNQGSTPQVVSAIGNVSFGPFAFGTNVVLTVVNNQDTSCSVTSSNLTLDACPPANDLCSNAIVLTPGGVFNDNPLVGTTVAATTATGLTYACQTSRANDVWYSVVVPPSGTITIETQADGASALTDTVLSVFSGTCGALVEVGCDDDAGSGNFSIVNLTQPAGSTLYIGVWRWSSAINGTFRVSAYDASLSSGSFDNANFSAYPNPVKDVLNVSYSTEISSIRVINMIGQEVISKNINATSTQVDMSQLSAGTYIVNVTVGDAIKTLKVVKQ